mgnify:FL=1
MEEKKLKLNYKRTFIIGLTFFTILMLWQMYNYYCPLFLARLLKNTYGDKDYNYLIGIIMAMDNVLALFLLPLFGNLSDKTHSKYGRRMPFIVVGTIVSMILFPLIPLFFAKNSLVGVIVTMGLVLIFMQMFRNPAVSLMPDVTPKPLRATANGIINFVGYIGAIFAGAIQMISLFKMPNIETEIPNPYLFIIPFAFTSILMLVSLIILIVKIKENKVLEEMKLDMEVGEQLAETEAASKPDHKLTKQDKTNLVLLIASIFLWYMGFNAVETFWSTYGIEVMNKGSVSIATVALTVASLITFIPAGKLVSKIGRKWSIILGLGLMIISLGGCFICSQISLKTNLVIYILLFVISGVGWAFINISSYPMVVEMSDKNSVGKYTGLYYTSSMLAQSITPICVGFLMDALGYESMFAYATGFMILALIVFVFIKSTHKPLDDNKSGFENFDIGDD